jgi:hypothetical protein
MTRPTFLIIGAMKAGTTSLYRYLAEHPQVFMARPKELNFFVQELNWERGIDWYEERFAGASSSAIALGEASTSYTKHPEFQGVPERIAERLPDVRLVYLVRHPVERMVSQYLHRLSNGKEHRPIEKALGSDPIYLNPSRYAMQLARYLEWFPRDRVLLVKSEDLRRSREATLGCIHRFIGVDPRFRSSAIDQEFYTRDDRRRSGRVMSRVRLAPATRAIRSVVPRGIRRRLVRAIGRPLEAGDAVITDELRVRLEDLVRGDVMRLRSYLGSGFDGWGIA